MIEDMNRIDIQKRRLVTAALPYVNNIPHLGNLIQVLSADVFARFCRAYGFETLYICGTDEYGTATETKAQQEGVSPQELCDHFHKIHKEIYDWFDIQFDYFGRTSVEKQTEIVQSIFQEIDHNGYILEKELEQLYCQACDRFLADRLVYGECPHCHYLKARGDQCEDCGKLLEPTDLISPQCTVCDKTPEIRQTKHLFLDLLTGELALESWFFETARQGKWTKNAISMTQAWLRDGLQNRCITRDLKWGIPVPKEGYENKVFYVWFDAPVGYISMTASHTDDWERWWRNNQDTQLFQFIGKDNIPFHSVLFPYSQLATGKSWTMVHHLSSSEYLNYETGKFSKSQGMGIFGNDCQDTGIPAEAWRFYLFYNRPETSDYQFTWSDFQDKVNQELIGNLGNLFNRTLTFIQRFYNNTIPSLPDNSDESDFYKKIKLEIRHITNDLNHARLKTALRAILSLSDMGNKAFQEAEPWKVCRDDPQAAAPLLHDLCYLLKDLSILLQPFLPQTSQKMQQILGFQSSDWKQLAQWHGLSQIGELDLLFHKLEDELIDELRDKYNGVQGKRLTPIVQDFSKQVLLKTGKVLEVAQHPDAERLYVFTIDAGEAEQRTIVSGLVENYTIEELQDRSIILVANLKPAKLRGVLSNGMLLTVENTEGELELLSSENIPVGTVVKVQDAEHVQPNGKMIKIDQFSQFPLRVQNKQVMIENNALTLKNEVLQTSAVTDGTVS